MIATRTVKLFGGPADGSQTIVSHDTAIVNGEVYVWGGGSDRNHFVHALTEIRTMNATLQKKEMRLVREWQEAAKHSANPVIADPDFPAWRINAWVQLFKWGTLE